MKTVVQIRHGRDFSANNLGVIDTEPVIDFPASAPLFAYRIRGSFSASALNRSGAFGSLEVGGADLTYTEFSGIGGLGRWLDAGAALPAGSLTLCAVVRVGTPPPSGHGLLVGSFTASPNTSLMYHSSGVYRAARLPGVAGVTNVTADTPVPDVSRWEFVSLIQDEASELLTIYLPRTGARVDAAMVGDYYRAGGGSCVVAGSQSGTSTQQPIEIALSSANAAALSTAEINAYYASARASLATAGIAI